MSRRFDAKSSQAKLEVVLDGGRKNYLRGGKEMGRNRIQEGED